MVRCQSRFNLFAFLFLIIVLGFSSCKTSREIPTAAHLKPIGTAKLLKNVAENSLVYESLSINRINCQFSNNQSRTSFKISLKAIKDKQILASITKLNIPIGRVLLTPDSVIYVNYIERNYFVDDYTYLSKFLNIDLDFSTIQSIISNNAFSYRNDEKDKDFKTFRFTCLRAEHHGSQADRRHLQAGPRQVIVVH